MIFSVKRNEFDSGIFGFPTAKIELDNSVDHQLSGKIIQQNSRDLLSNLEKEYEYAVIRYPSSLFNITHILEDVGFRIVDVTVQLQNPLTLTIPDFKKEVTIREAQESDIPELQDLTRGIFHHSRFFNDPFIGREKAHEIYRAWINNCVMKNVAFETLVAEYEGALCGFIGIKNNGHVSLIGVREGLQGKGIGKQLLYAALEKFIEWGLPEAVIETQATNIPAIRAYQSCGYKMYQTYLTLRWVKKK